MNTRTAMCTSCSFENPENAKFCQKCGQPLDRVCPQCNTANDQSAKFCMNCGTPLQVDENTFAESRLRSLQQSTPLGLQKKMMAAQAHHRGERRTVTILFTDIVGSTSIASELDPEDWREIVAGVHRRVSEAIYRYEGTITQLLGDGILAFFGAPVAHEDDPIRAVHAALEIQKRIQEFGHQIADQVESLQMRAGINTGTVVIGDIGTDMHVEYLAFGDAVNVAARLESAAEPRTVLVSEETYNLVEHVFEMEDLGGIKVKGKDEPVPTRRILGIKAQPSKARGIPGLESSLVGRDEELRLLLEAIEGLKQGNGSVVTLIGEAGIGKSRLVAELWDGISEDDLQWVEGRCLSYARTIPYQLWLCVLRVFLNIGIVFESERVDELFHKWLQELFPDRFEEIYPFLGRLLSLPLDDSLEAKVQSLKGGDLKTAIFQAMEWVLESESNACPLILLCEDIHWADPTSIELLESVLPLVERNPILILCVFRPERVHPVWGMRDRLLESDLPYHKEIWLDPLEFKESQRLVNNLLQVEKFPSSLAEKVLSHAEGNPFYLEEILRSLIDQEVIIQHEVGKWQIAEDIEDLPIPNTVQGVLLARIDRLREEEKNLLQRASVIGRTFELALLEHIFPYSELAFKDGVEILAEKEFIHPLNGGVHGQYTFRHALTQEVAYQVLLKRQRRQIHGEVGDALESIHAETIEEQVELLAYHYLQAEFWDKAWSYQVKAGRKAMGRFANQEAMDYFQQALDIGHQVPEVQPINLAELKLYISEILNGTNDYEKAISELKSGLSILSETAPIDQKVLLEIRIHQLMGVVYRTMGDFEKAIKAIHLGLETAGEGYPALRGALKIAMASTLTRQGELVEAQRWCEEAIEEVEAVEELADLAHAYSLYGTIRRDQGDTTSSLSYRQRSLEISQKINHLHLQNEAHNNLAVAYYDLGELDKASYHYEKSLEICHQIGNIDLAARAEINLGENYLIQGKWNEAEQVFQHAIEVWTRNQYQLGIAYGSSNMGAVLTRKGELEDALEYLEQSESIFNEIGAEGFLPIVYRRQALAHLADDNLELAEELSQKSLDLARENSRTHDEGAALRVLAMIHCKRGEIAQAEDLLEESIEMLRLAGIRYEEARSCLELAKIWGQAEQQDRIPALLDPAMETFKEMGAMVDLGEAEAVLVAKVE